MLLNKNIITEKIKQICLDEGFIKFGVAKATPLYMHKKKLQKWVANSYQASMNFMKRNQEKRENPGELLDNCNSVISLAINYYNEVTFDPQNQYVISKYALGKDYHYIIKDKLKRIIEKITELSGVNSHRGFVDSAPVFEKAWAVMSGIGWVGKNSCLIIPKMGSYFFLAEIFTTLELNYNSEFKNNYCGSCEKCVNSCPTKAIVNPGVIDSNRCISYLTIESKSDIPDNIKEKLNGKIFGCDTCQDVCPWNKRFSCPATDRNFLPDERIMKLTKKDWESMSEEDFESIFGKIKSPLARTGYNKIMMNIKAQNAY